MMPTAIMIPAALPPGLFGALVDPGTIVTGVGAIVAAVAVGVCVAIVRERPARVPRVETFSPAQALAA